MKIRDRILDIFLLFIIGGITLFFLWPIYWMITGSFKNLTVALQIPPEWIPLNPTLDNYIKLFVEYPTMRWFFNSVFISACTTILVIFASSMAAYAIAKIKFKGSKALFSIFIASMTLPHTLLFIPLFRVIVNMGLPNTYIGVILPIVGWPFGVFLLKQFMQTIPQELIDAGKIDGCSELGLYLRVIMPLAKPGIGALAIFTFVNSWNDYTWQLVMLKKESMFTLPLGVQIAKSKQEIEVDYGIAMAGATLATIPVLIVFLAFQKYFTKGITMGAIKG